MCMRMEGIVVSKNDLPSLAAAPCIRLLFINNYSMFRVGIIGATGMVGQRYITLLQGHPWFKVTCVAASAQSAGVSYGQSVKNRWQMSEPMPKAVSDLTVIDANDIDQIAHSCDFVFVPWKCRTKKSKTTGRKLGRRWIAGHI